MNRAAKVERLLAALGRKDRASRDHSLRVAAAAGIIARALGVRAPAAIRLIQTGALLHDLGKLAVPTTVLHSRLPHLTSRQRRLVERHPWTGWQQVMAELGNAAVANIVHQHHERWDGAGYPRRLRGHRICRGARICAVADAYDTIRHGRPYCRGKGPTPTFAEIARGAGTRYDPRVVAALARCRGQIEAAVYSKPSGSRRQQKGAP